MGGSRSVNNVSTLKETFEEEIYTRIYRDIYFCARTCRMHRCEGRQIIGDDRTRVKLKLDEDRKHSLSLKRERMKQTKYFRAA
jgi:hypothetical protein